MTRGNRDQWPGYRGTNNRVRYSAAARYKKQGGRRDSHAFSTCPTEGAAATSKDGEESQTGAVKRPRTDPNTPLCRSKGQEVDAQATISLVPATLLPLTYPDRKLNGKKLHLVKKLIKGRILDLVKGTKAPLLKSTSERDRPENGWKA